MTTERWRRCVSLLAIALALLACGGEDEAQVITVRSWALSADTLAEPVAFSSPGNVEGIATAPSYTLTSEVTLPAEMQGKKLTLTVPALVAIATLRANGQEAPLVDSWPLSRSSRPGWQAWHIMPRDTQSSTLRLELEVEHYRGINRMVGTFRLSATPYGDRRYMFTRRVNEWGSVAAIGSLLTTAILYGISYAIDRRRSSHAWFTVQSLMALVAVVSGLGVLQPWLGRLDISVWLLASATAGTVGIQFLYSHFGERGSPHILLTGPVAVYLSTHASIPGVPLLLAGCCLFAMVTCWRWSRDERRRVDARLLLVAWLFAGAFLLVQMLDLGNLGLFTQPLSFLCFNLLQVVVVARERVVSFKSGEALNVELRRQVAERSRELATTFARLEAGAAGQRRLQVGDIVDGRYRVTRSLGEGGMGQVVEVTRIADGERLALKVISERSTTQRLARFAREAQIAAELRHANLVSVTDVGVDPAGRMFLVMELVRGGSLSERRDRFGEVRWALLMIRQIAEGLAAIHRRGIVHRDLKPANVLVDGDVAKIADFGISALGDGTNDDDERTEQIDDLPSPLTRTGVVIGTPQYMAPELAGGAKNAQPSADVFSLGIVAHELLTRTLPAGSEQRPLSLPGLANEAAELLCRCLDREPTRRPSAEEIAQRLAP